MATTNTTNTKVRTPDNEPEVTSGEVSSFELRILDPKKMKVFHHAGVPRLTLDGERSWTKIAPARTFPLSDPEHYIGFLDGAGKDIGILYDPAQLESASRHVVEEEIERRYFVPVIDRVISVKEEFGAVYWNVETDRGEKEIVVRNLRDNMQELSATRMIVTDVDGNRYEIPDVTNMDNKSQAIIMRNL